MTKKDKKSGKELQLNNELFDELMRKAATEEGDDDAASDADMEELTLTDGAEDEIIGQEIEELLDEAEVLDKEKDAGKVVKTKREIDEEEAEKKAAVTSQEQIDKQLRAEQPIDVAIPPPTEPIDKTQEADLESTEQVEVEPELSAEPEVEKDLTDTQTLPENEVALQRQKEAEKKQITKKTGKQEGVEKKPQKVAKPQQKVAPKEKPKTVVKKEPLVKPTVEPADKSKDATEKQTRERKSTERTRSDKQATKRQEENQKLVTKEVNSSIISELSKKLSSVKGVDSAVTFTASDSSVAFTQPSNKLTDIGANLRQKLNSMVENFAVRALRKSFDKDDRDSVKGRINLNRRA